jgi:UDP-N-acetylglucosamine:LPS N-acetylglucosamine transferase
LIFNQQRLAEMRKSMESLATPDAAQKISQMIKNLAENANGGFDS